MRFCFFVFYLLVFLLLFDQNNGLLFKNKCLDSGKGHLDSRQVFPLLLFQYEANRCNILQIKLHQIIFLLVSLFKCFKSLAPCFLPLEFHGVEFCFVFYESHNLSLFAILSHLRSYCIRKKKKENLRGTNRPPDEASHQDQKPWFQGAFYSTLSLQPDREKLI